MQNHFGEAPRKRAAIIGGGQTQGRKCKISYGVEVNQIILGGERTSCVSLIGWNTRELMFPVIKDSTLYVNRNCKPTKFPNCEAQARVRQGSARDGP